MFGKIFSSGGLNLQELSDKVVLNFLKGDNCEQRVFKEITEFLKGTFQIDDKLTGFFVLKNALNVPCVRNGRKEVNEIDLVVIHPLLGVYFLEVKDWSEKFLKNNGHLLKATLDKLKRNADCFMNRIKSEFPRLPLRVHHKLIFCGEDADKYLKTLPEGWKEKITTLKRFKQNSAEIFETQLNASLDEEVFRKILSLLKPVNTKELIRGFFVSPNGIYVIDKIAAKILRSYQGGLKIVRGVAGTGKSFVLLEFVKTKPDENKLIFCFNRALADKFGELLEEDKSVKVYTLLGFIRKKVKPRLDFKTLKDFKIKDREKFEKFVEFLGSRPEIVKAFKEALSDFVKEHNVNYPAS